ncbi:hypothetical protein [Gemmobacter serpentinus]|uniref:hypothetical protein n=1 Tax=Gemmobacter serpentinus TaxID=2652247 RepID=UPI00124EBFD5|nr:hypothetical protein [Gemmobacter serpentinus]
MSINVFAWPPVGALGFEWTHGRPVARLRSMLTGRDQMQASQRKRRIATLQVSALGNGANGAGFCEILKDMLDGGIHAVRLRSSPINWHRHYRPAVNTLNSTSLTWRTGSDPLAWQASGQPLRWYDGRMVTASGASSPQGMWHGLTLSGLPVGTLVARPGDYIRAYEMSDPAVSQMARVVRPATTDAAGAVTLRLDRAITISNARVNLAEQDEGAFRVEGGLPRAVQPLSGDWSYTWSFREVFADEVGGFVERDPWN